MTTPSTTPQRPLWQQLGIWLIALVLAGGLIQAGNSALSEPEPQDSLSTPTGNSPATDDTPRPDPTPAPAPQESETADDGPAAADESTSETSPEPETVGYLTAAQQLETLPIAPRDSRDGYDREEQFGSAWIDVNNNGCDTRNDILRRDLDDTVIDSRCRVLSGTLLEPVTGDLIEFVRGQQTSALVQIDHVVSLSNAWQTGAQRLTQAQRVALANDPLNLMAMSGSLNQQKGDSDAASWLPPRFEFWCEYVARQVGVKSHYSLWVTQAERDQMARVLSECPAFPALTPREHGTLRPGTVPTP